MTEQNPELNFTRRSMARERIIGLRQLSAERNSSLLASTSVNKSCSNDSDGDDYTVVDRKDYPDSDSDSPCTNQKRRSHLATDGYFHSRKSGYEDDDNDYEDEEPNQNVALIRHLIPRTRVESKMNTCISNLPKIEVVDTQGLISSSFDPFRETLDMGKFMDQVTKISTGIDSIEIDLNDNQPRFLADQTFRFKIYQKLEEELIPNLVLLQATAFLSSSNSTTNNDNNTEEGSSSLKYQLDGTHQLHSDLSYDNSNPDYPLSFSRDVENPLKREQINLLASKLNLTLYRIKDHLNSEKRMLGNEIKYEWHKELSQYSSSNSRSTSRSTEDISELGTIKNYHNQDDPTDQTLFKLMGLDENDQVSLPVFESNSNEVHKRLNLAVRYSTSYPQARKSSLFILSEFDQIKQIQIDLEQINLLFQLLAKHSLHYPHLDETRSEEESSSVSFSLDGLDEDVTVTNYDEKGLSQDTLKRKETYKKIRFCFNTKNKHLTEKDDQSIEKATEYDLESNRHRLSLISHNPSLTKKVPSFIFIRWFYQYRLALLISIFLSILLGCGAFGFYLILRRHDN